MPTGYTAPVQDGEMTDLAEFAWNCARAFFYDDSMPASLVKEPDKYAANRYEEALDKLARAEAMTLGEAMALAVADYEHEKKALEESLERSRVYRERYEAMLAKVQTWELPTDEHRALKAFMVQQLEDSIRWDCNIEHTEGALAELKVESAEEYRQNRIAWAKEDVEHCRKRVESGLLNVQETTEWLQALNASLQRPAQKRNRR